MSEPSAVLQAIANVFGAAKDTVMLNVDLSAATLGEIEDLVRRLRNIDLINFSMESCAIGARRFTMVAKQVARQETLKDLSLAGNELRNSGAILLADALIKSGTDLTSLNLANNAIGEEGAHALARAFTFEDEKGFKPHLTQSLQYLNFSTNDLLDAGLEAVAPSFEKLHALTHLDLSYNHVQNLASHIYQHLPPKLVRLNLLCNGHVETDYYLNQLTLDEEGVAKLNQKRVGLPDLLSVCGLKGTETHLDWGGRGIGQIGGLLLASDLGMGEIRLVELNLANNGIGVAGTVALAGALSCGRTPLQSLDLSHNSIMGRTTNEEDDHLHNHGSREGLEALLVSPPASLTELNLAHNLLKGDGARAVQAALASGRMPRIRKISVSMNFVLEF